MEPEDPNPGLLLDHLSDDLIAQCLGHLDMEGLATAELVCHRFQDIVRDKDLWKSLCQKIYPNLPRMSISMAGQLPFLQEDSDRHPMRLLAAARKRLCKDLTNPNAAPSLISEALVATSTDHPAEALLNVLNPQSVRRTQDEDIAFYWSSTGSEDEESCESITFRLAHSACLVTSVELRPFKAFFQTPRRPVYAPKRIRIFIGGIHCYHAADGKPRPLHDVIREAEADVKSQDAHRAAQGGAGQVPLGSSHAHSPAGISGVSSILQPSLEPQQEGEQREEPGRWVGETWISKEYPFENIDEVQPFDIPPTLCLGGYLRIDLNGRTETQDADERYYTCLSYARCIGTPLYNFIGRPVYDHNLKRLSILEVIPDDPLLVHGGLESVSERGWNPPEMFIQGLGEGQAAALAQLGPAAVAGLVNLGALYGIHIPLLLDEDDAELEQELEELEQEENDDNVNEWEEGELEELLLGEEQHVLQAGDWGNWIDEGLGGLNSDTSSDSD